MWLGNIFERYFHWALKITSRDGVREASPVNLNRTGCFQPDVRREAASGVFHGLRPVKCQNRSPVNQRAAGGRPVFTEPRSALKKSWVMWTGSALLFHHDCAEMCFHILSNSWHVLRQCWGVKNFILASLCLWPQLGGFKAALPDTSYFLCHQRLHHGLFLSYYTQAQNLYPWNMFY